ncbi:MAG TPA: DNA mismatch repair endonuclease MutL [Prolixibacteraceae bacterium]|nr:DNA mismatch repair endonuclease MutL [Prolixibacteraceae bacterium]
MTDIIRLLPDSVANQIAAGEVIQRPASVVKELVENALDSGADEIIIHIKDSGRTLIQVTDNGCGMSPTDARMAFERHATSKISSANDLFAIRTMGFRGEALASIAAIADVELRTKRVEDETGTFLHLTATRVITQEPFMCGNGSNVQVKNLFFNLPARRKFLKSDATEMKLIINEIHRIAIPNPEISFTLVHNNSTIYELPAGNTMKRLAGLFGKSISQALIPVESQTSVISIAGYTGLPKFARKTMGEQFFFVNRRFMKHPWFHKAVMQAYEKLLPPDAFPSYFFLMDINPGSIDINVHPTKTEIKFEDDRAIWQLLNAAVREALGKHSAVPSIDFDQAGSVEIPMPPKPGQPLTAPQIAFNPDYNPFHAGGSSLQGTSTFRQSATPGETQNLRHWEKLYSGMDQARSRFEQPDEQSQGRVFPETSIPYSGKKVFQFKQKYLVLPVKSGMMLIDQKRAQERILFEKIRSMLQSDTVSSQQILFPHTFELNSADTELLKEILPDLESMGFDIREFGKDTFIVSGVPGVLESTSPTSLIEKLLEEYKNTPVDATEKVRDQVAISLSKASAVSYGVDLQPEMMDHIIDQLFACSSPNFTPDGKPTLTIISLEDIDRLFGR